MYSWNSEERKILIAMGFEILEYDENGRSHEARIGRVIFRKDLSQGSPSPYIVWTPSSRREFRNSWEGFYEGAASALVAHGKALGLLQEVSR